MKQLTDEEVDAAKPYFRNPPTPVKCPHCRHYLFLICATVTAQEVLNAVAKSGRRPQALSAYSTNSYDGYICDHCGKYYTKKELVAAAEKLAIDAMGGKPYTRPGTAAIGNLNGCLFDKRGEFVAYETTAEGITCPWCQQGGPAHLTGWVVPVACPGLPEGKRHLVPVPHGTPNSFPQPMRVAGERTGDNS